MVIQVRAVPMLASTFRLGAIIPARTELCVSSQVVFALVAIAVVSFLVVIARRNSIRTANPTASNSTSLPLAIDALGQVRNLDVALAALVARLRAVLRSPQLTPQESGDLSSQLEVMRSSATSLAQLIAQLHPMAVDDSPVDALQLKRIAQLEKEVSALLETGEATIAKTSQLIARRVLDDLEAN